MKAKKETKKVEKKSERITLDIPIEERAKGVKPLRGNPKLLGAKSSGENLPASLRTIFDKVNAKGKDGIHLDTLAPRDPKTGRCHARWHIRTLINLKYLLVVDEPKAEKPKHVTIAGAVKAKLRKTAHKSNAARKAA